MISFQFDNTYDKLPERFYARVAPAKVAAPRVVAVNQKLAELLGLDAAALASPEGAALLSGNVVPEGASSIALAYAGHQFGAFVRQLGDGRALLLGEIVGKDGVRRDIQLKGSGRTPFSRGGDGRAALGPVLREYVVSEAMFALGVPTTRTLAAVTTGERVARETVLPGAVLTRVAASHLRVGTFQYFAARGDQDAVAKLVSYALDRHYPDARGGDNDAVALLDRVIEAQAKLVAQWVGVGFIHGVMNTDNTSISGETIDYGPCAFLDEYDPMKTFSSIDAGGRYAFGNQPMIAAWNCARLADTLLPLIAADEREAVRIAQERLERFGEIFGEAHLRVLRAKLGLTRELEDDAELARDLFERMAGGEIDFTVFFRKLCAAAEDERAAAELFADAAAWQGWSSAWRARLAEEEASITPEVRAQAMKRVNPAIIPRNHLIEALIDAAVERDDFAPFEAMLRAIERPYDDPTAQTAPFTRPPSPGERVTATFCGT